MGLDLGRVMEAVNGVVSGLEPTVKALEPALARILEMRRQVDETTQTGKSADRKAIQEMISAMSKDGVSPEVLNRALELEYQQRGETASMISSLMMTMMGPALGAILRPPHSPCAVESEVAPEDPDGSGKATGGQPL